MAPFINVTQYFFQFSSIRSTKKHNNMDFVIDVGEGITISLLDDSHASHLVQAINENYSYLAEVKFQRLISLNHKFCL